MAMSTPSSSKTTTNQANAAATTTTTSRRRRSATASKNDNSNSNRGSSFKNDLIFVGIPFLLTQIFLFRKQIHYYTVGGSLQGGNSDSTSTTGTASSTLLDFDLPQQTTNQRVAPPRYHFSVIGHILLEVLMTRNDGHVYTKQ